MLNKEQIESVYEKLKIERNKLIVEKNNAKDLKKEKEVINAIEKLEIEITLLECILEC